ncbi:Preimplantation protein 3 [Giardia muris]|uniref:Preimplantation protein 3 n=1 Tax=Giardia muris TaxID=5742 RepID=A0A4Z1TC95_GIAMU|nr:Preimplantation protein 3 [Giardia muris]|eukprot:TNJ30179.1 Preimplantation protein 3 [Giardia muris]
MTFVVEAGMPDPRPYPSSYYDERKILRLPKVLNETTDPRVIQSAIRDYLDSLMRACPSQLDPFFELGSCSSAITSKILRFENLRLILQEMSHLLSCLADVCDKTTCPTMLATPEWKFLCTVHSSDPQDCCAISYCSHLLDSGEPNFVKSCSADFLNSGNKAQVQEAQKTYSFLERRSYRILAHAHFHHKEVFTEFERKRYLYRRFLKYLTIWAPKQPTQLVPTIDLEGV